MLGNIQEIILIDKPKGITSFDVIRQLRRKFGIRKMGHAGTLDPLASGLMIIGVEKGTKKLEGFLKLPKVYEADVFIGRKTTTADMEGEVVLEKNVDELNLEEVDAVLQDLVGKIRLPVPIYSAIKVQGKPLYKSARQGKTDIEVPIKTMEIFWIKLLDCYRHENFYIIKIEMEVASGTYIRSVAEEIGKRLGYPAVVKDLRRTRIGDFLIDEAERL